MWRAREELFLQETSFQTVHDQGCYKNVSSHLFKLLYFVARAQAHETPSSSICTVEVDASSTVQQIHAPFPAAAFSSPTAIDSEANRSAISNVPLLRLQSENTRAAMPPMKAPKAFPLALSIGTDICSISRIRTILSGRHAQAFVRKVLRREERAQSAGILCAVERWHALNSARTRRAERHSLKFGSGVISARSNGPMGALRSPEEDASEPPSADENSGTHILEQDREAFGGGWPRASHLPASGGDDVTDHGSEGGERFGPEMCVDTRQETDADDLDTALDRCAQLLAGRFAAKEAAMKAHHSRRLTYHSVCILKPPAKGGETGSTPPLAVVLSEQGELRGDLEGAKEVQISISHDGGFAVANCLAADQGGSGEERMDSFAEAFRFGATGHSE
ncbi:hypothetical protein JHW43_002191 [Diplocarpon mali]|nr:hypothetical protein JHW43_002191 [Diplocarpon mali]